MLFQFKLTPLDAIQAWGPPENRRLHWFGLTDGQYWMEVGPDRLFEYSETARRHGAPRFCDYQVARLYEDVVDMAPDALDAVPPDLVPFIAGSGRRRTQARLAAWCDEQGDRDDDDYWRIVDSASTWLGRRRLETSHLSPGADILMWSDGAILHVEWDHRDRLIAGACAWSASCGSHALPRSDFLRECRSFHDRLMEAMSERIDQVMAGALTPDIQVDVASLVREHQERAERDLALDPTPATTDWQSVREALRTVGA